MSERGHGYFEPPHDASCSEEIATMSEQLAAANATAAEQAATITRLREGVEVLRRTWDALCRCVDEFEPEDMQACGERRDDLDTAILALLASAAEQEPAVAEAEGE